MSQDQGTDTSAPVSAVPPPDIAADKLLLQRFYHHAKARPDAPYLTQPLGGGKVDVYSFARVLDEASRMGAHLRSLELPERSQIAILSKNCAHFIMTDLAIWMAGHVSVAIYPTLDADSVGFILDHSESKLLFVGKLDTWETMKPGVPEDMPLISYPLSPKGLSCPTWNDLIKESEPLDDTPTRDAEEMAIIIYTSGSTGVPKGVMLSFGAMAIAVNGINQRISCDHNDRMLSYLPMAHALERVLVTSNALTAGLQVFFAESLHTFVDDIKRARPTLFVSVPRLWLKFQLGVYSKMPEKKLRRLLKIPIIKNIVKKKILGNLGLDHVRFAGSGSAPIPAELIQWYRNLGLELLEGYGMSENFGYSHGTPPGDGRPGYVGTPYPGVEHRISDQGEILVKSPASMMGYFKLPEQTAESFTEDGFLKTGDRGEIDAHGRLKITGRVKELFKTSKGKYIAPAPIENIINNDPNVELSCVSGSGYPSAHAVVQLAEDLRPKLSEPDVRKRVEADLTQLLEKVNGKVAHHEHLAFFAIASEPWTIESGHLTPTMKIKRTAIEDAYIPALDGWYDAKKKVVWEAT